MSKRRSLVVVLSALALLIGCAPEPQHAAPLPTSKIEVRSPHVELVATTAPDPCADYGDLEAGRGTPERQDLFNHLDARGYARWHAACWHHWGGSEWTCLDSIWTKESGWRSDIYGRIPQAMPETKIASHGPDWKTNPRVQVRWGEDYIADRYGRPSLAGTTPPYTRQSCDAGY